MVIKPLQVGLASDPWVACLLGLRYEYLVPGSYAPIHLCYFKEKEYRGSVVSSPVPSLAYRPFCSELMSHGVSEIVDTLSLRLV